MTPTAIRIKNASPEEALYAEFDECALDYAYELGLRFGYNRKRPTETIVFLYEEGKVCRSYAILFGKNATSTALKEEFEAGYRAGLKN